MSAAAPSRKKMIKETFHHLPWQGNRGRRHKATGRRARRRPKRAGGRGGASSRRGGARWPCPAFRGGGGREERAKPLGEGAEIQAEEDVDGVDDEVVRVEVTVSDDP
jgi:hypothetical protein